MVIIIPKPWVLSSSLISSSNCSWDHSSPDTKPSVKAPRGWQPWWLAWWKTYTSRSTSRVSFCSWIFLVCLLFLTLFCLFVLFCLCFVLFCQALHCAAFIPEAYIRLTIICICIRSLIHILPGAVRINVYQTRWYWITAVYRMALCSFFLFFFFFFFFFFLHILDI